jgi:hypothetical protein
MKENIIVQNHPSDLNSNFRFTKATAIMNTMQHSVSDRGCMHSLSTNVCAVNLLDIITCIIISGKGDIIGHTTVNF